MCMNLMLESKIMVFWEIFYGKIFSFFGMSHFWKLDHLESNLQKYSRKTLPSIGSRVYGFMVLSRKLFLDATQKFSKVLLFKLN